MSRTDAQAAMNEFNEGQIKEMLDYDPKAFYEALSPEKRAEYDQLTARINERERAMQAQAAPGQLIPPDKEPEEPESPPEG